MKIERLGLYNFRRFKDRLFVHFNKELTVFAANNGAGKTTILDAIAIAYGALLSRLPKVSGNALSEKDICLQSNDKEPLVGVLVETFAHEMHQSTTELLRASTTWQRLKGRKGRRRSRHVMEYLSHITETSGLKQINALADYMIDHEKSDTVFPILAYYGTGRAVMDIPQRRRGFSKEFPRFHAYADCLNPKTNFRKLFEQFYFLEDLERREKEQLTDWNYRNGQLQGIREAVNVFLHGKYSHPRTAIRPLRFLLDDADGVSYRIEQLSDGYKTSLAMVMDIASRMVEANPDLGAEALKSPGMVLIDEIELHLHPSWQQTIIPDLRRTFPNVQFICTTHSPQILSTVKPESIRIITDDGTVIDGKEAGVNTYGAQSYFILEDLMNVSPNPRIVEVEELKNKLKLRMTSRDLQVDDPEIERLESMVGPRDPFVRNLKAIIIKSSKSHA
jgi:predicted ATP-binding protein involved in virulence